jgi:hypothetical protein
MPDIEYRLRINPLHDNICHDRIGMYRKLACYDCSKLAECDQHFNEKTGEWDYPNPLELSEVIPMRKKGRYSSASKKGAQTVSQIADRKRRSLIEKGLASRLNPMTTLSEAIEKAGI